MKLSIADPHWLFTSGDSGRLEVLRSSFLREDNTMVQPLRQFIADNGLVLAAHETFRNEHFMWGEVEASVYMPPDARNAAYARGATLSLTTEGFAGAGPDIAKGTALEHVTEHWPFPSEAEDEDTNQRWDG